jgi:hypothetical protein
MNENYHVWFFLLMFTNCFKTVFSNDFHLKSSRLNYKNKRNQTTLTDMSTSAQDPQGGTAGAATADA